MQTVIYGAWYTPTTYASLIRVLEELEPFAKRELRRNWRRTSFHLGPA
eukprot:gene16403-5007_t